MLEAGTCYRMKRLVIIIKDSKFTYDTVEQTSTITDPTIISKLTNTILDTQYTPWVDLLGKPYLTH
jgi:hypothetical protein